jgi:hypothetical protein
MRIAAGIVLIIAALINIFAAIGYLGAGGAVAAGGKLTQLAEEQARKEGRTMTPEEKQAMAQLNAASSSMKTSPGALMGFGAFLVLTVVTSIIGAVSLFQGKRAKFILVAGVLAAAAEVVGILITTFGFTNIIGLAAAALAIIAARSIGARAAAQGSPAVA